MSQSAQPEKKLRAGTCLRQKSTAAARLKLSHFGFPPHLPPSCHVWHRFDLLLMSVKSKKLRGVTFYLHHMDMQLKEKKKKKERKKRSQGLWPTCKLYSNTGQNSSALPWRCGKNPTAMYIIHMRQVSHFQSPQRLGFIPRTRSRGAEVEVRECSQDRTYCLWSLSLSLPRHVGGRNKLKNGCLLQHWPAFFNAWRLTVSLSHFASHIFWKISQKDINIWCKSNIYKIVVIVYFLCVSQHLTSI